MWSRIRSCRKARAVAVATLGVAVAEAAGATAWNEVGDAGELVATAQQPTGVGALTSISGSLASATDVDLYSIQIDDPSSFAVTVAATLSVDNDGQLFLFDASGSLVLSDDDDGAGLLPGFSAGELSGAAGVYLLAFDVFNVDPIGDPLTGWNKNPSPAQSGPYTLTLAGTNVVPEPGTGLLLGLGLVLLGARRSARDLPRRRAQWPVNRGFRFSRKAFWPSRASSLCRAAVTRPWASARASSDKAAEDSTMSSTRFMPRTASGAFEAISSASAKVAASRSARGTRRSTRPISRTSSPL